MIRLFLQNNTIVGFMFLIFCSPFLSEAQEKVNKLNINIQSNYFIAKQDYQDATFNKINPGGEILYELGLNKRFSFLTGLNYIYSTWNYSMGPASFFKIIAHETFIPVILNEKLCKKMNIAIGIYPGRIVYLKSLYTDKIEKKHWINNTKYTDYASSQKFSADLYMETGFNQPFKKYTIKFAPFIKYKLTDNWMGEYRERITYGFKINTAFEL